ncbi:MAG: acetyl-CoA carboxylase biotin carboxylase subunit, partial [Limisphaerales bacterium]
YGKDRKEALAKMVRAMNEFIITGIKTTIPFQLEILKDPNFARGTYSTNFVDSFFESAGRKDIIEDKI